MAGRALSLAVPLAAAAGLTLLAGHLANDLLLGERVVQLRASEEHNIWSWASSMTTLAAGLASAYLGFLTGRRVPLALAALLAFFALDDFIEVHERLGVTTGDALGFPEWLSGRVWTALYLPLLALAVLLGRHVVRDLAESVRRTIALGVLLLVAGFALEVVGAGTKWLEERGRPGPHMVRAGLEEGAELAGWVLVAAGLTAGGLAAAASSSPRGPQPEQQRTP